MIIDQILRSYGTYVRFSTTEWGILTSQSYTEIEEVIYRGLKKGEKVMILNKIETIEWFNSTKSNSVTYFQRFV